MRPALSLLVVLLLSALPTAQQVGTKPPEPPARRPPAVERYPFLYDFTGGAESWSKLPYERLILGRKGCYGICPVYEVTLRRDGSARYTGGQHAPREGEFEGDVGLYAYALLCAAAEDLDLEGMQGEYSSTWTDDETIVVEWERDGKTQRVRDYGRRAPPAFHAYRALFDELAAQIEWKPVGEKR